MKYLLASLLLSLSLYSLCVATECVQTSDCKSTSNTGYAEWVCLDVNPERVFTACGSCRRVDANCPFKCAKDTDCSDNGSLICESRPFCSCDVTHKVCVNAQCSSDSDCIVNNRCSSGRCVARTCAQDQDCPSGHAGHYNSCSGGKCTYPSCATLGKTCYGGQGYCTQIRNDVTSTPPYTCRAQAGFCYNDLPVPGAGPQQPQLLSHQEGILQECPYSIPPNMTGGNPGTGTGTGTGGGNGNGAVRNGIVWFGLVVCVALSLVL